MSIGVLFGPFAPSGVADTPALSGMSVSDGSLEFILVPRLFEVIGSSTSSGSLAGALGASQLTPYDTLIADIEALVSSNMVELTAARLTFNRTDDLFWSGQVQLANRALDQARRARAISVRIRG